MKTTSELTYRETKPYNLNFNNHGILVVNERLDYDYFLGKVAENIWVADLNKLPVML